MRLPAARHVAIALLGILACRDTTGPSASQVEQYRAQWLEHQIHDYAYQYLSTGFFNSLSGQSIQVTVRADTVRAATFVASGDTVPAGLAVLPTIAQLFDGAEAAAANGTLKAMRLDPTLTYPTELEFSGPPDASGTLRISHFQVLPWQAATR